MSKKISVFVLLLLLTSCFFNMNKAVAQNTFSSEEDLKKKASKLFDEEEYVQAYPLYSQLLSIYPKDPNYNYHFGVCMMYATENKDKALPYLEAASKSPKVDPEVFFFLGRAYHLNYRFDDAIRAYNQFKKTGSKNSVLKLKPDAQIIACNSGKTLLRSIKDLTVVEKKEVGDADFFRSYDLKGIGGKLLVKPDDFKTPFDLKKNEKSIIFLGSKNNKVYYSSYGVDGKQGKDIYFSTRLPSGEWGTPQNLGPPINTDLDEDYPFMHPNGKVLYFCSKGHNSMGGYDVFKSTLDPNTGKWSEPVNLDFPINTPDDEIMYVTDSLEQIACFASARNSASGMTAVYKTKTDRKPIDAAVVNGKFVKAPSQKDYKSKITIKNLESNELEGTFYSNVTTGDYLLQLSNGGKFLFTVESEGFNSQSEVVQINKQEAFKPITQYISYDGEGKLKLTTNFEEAPSDTSYLKVMAFIKDKAKLDVNYNEANDIKPAVNPVTAGDNPVATNPSETKSSPALSNDDLVKMAKDDAKEADTEAKDLRSQANNAYAIANEKNNLAQEKQKEADDARNNANTSQDPAQKQAALDKVNAIQLEADKLAKETITSFNFATKLDANATNKQEEANLSMKYATEVENLSKSKNPKEALAKLEEQKKELDKFNSQPPAEDPYKSIKSDADRKQKEADEAVQKSEGLKKDIANSEMELKKMRAEIEKEKKQNVREGQEQMANEIADDIVLMKKQLEESDIKAAKLQKEADGLKNDAELVSSVISKVKTSTTPAPELAAADKQKLEKSVAVYKNDIQASNNEAAQNSATPPKEKPLVGVVSPGEPATTSKPLISVVSTSGDNAPAINEKYTKELASAEQKAPGVEREQARADVYKKWSDEINTDVARKKEELNTITDPQQKAAAEQKIKEQEQLATEKQKLAKPQSPISVVDAGTNNVTPGTSGTPSIKTSGKDSAAPGIASSTTPASVSVTDTAGTSINKYTTELNAANKQPDGYEKEKAKSIAYKNWTDELVREKEKRTAALPGITDEKQKEKEIVKIQELTALAIEKQKLYKESEEKISKQEPVAVTGNKASSSADGNTPVNPSVQPNGNAPDLKSGNPASSSKPVAVKETPPSYVNDTPEQLKEKLSVAVKESGDYRQQAAAARAEAAGKSTPEEKEPIIKKAVELEELAKKKDVEIVEIEGASKKTEFNQKDNELNQLARLTAQNKKEGDDITRADLWRDESKIYFEKAQEDRKKAALSNDDDTKQELIQKASDKEKMALEKQKSANEVYMKYNPDFVYDPNASATAGIANNKNQQPAESNNTAEPPPTNKQENKQATAPVAGNNQSVRNSSNTPSTAQSNNPNETEAQKLERIKNLPEYKDYTNLIAASRSEEANSQQEYKVADGFKTKSNEQSSLANETSLQTEKETDPSKKADLIKKAGEYNNMAKIYKQRYDSTLGLAKNSAATASSKQREADLLVQTMDTKVNESKPEISPEEKRARETAMAAGVSPEPFLKGLKSNNKSAAVPEEFAPAGKTVYSANNPIPINQPLPPGLYFKVQIGAFKKPIPQDLFKGMKPLSGETTKNGYLRYTAGLFSKFNTADDAKNKIRTMGYKDAFVVAFYNGKRYPVSEAIAMAQKDGAAVETSALAENTGNPPAEKPNTPVNTTPGNVGQTNNTPAAENNHVNSGTRVLVNPGEVKNSPTTPSRVVPANQPASVNSAPKTTALENIEGLLYTVQIGVYSKPVTSVQLFNISPIYTETMPNGNKRYTTGVYNKRPKADQAKDVIVGIGVKDAFVVAFRNGKRVTMDEAARIELKGGNEMVSDANVSELPAVNKNNNNPSPVQPQQTNNNRQSATSGSASTGKVLYKVQIGAFKEQVPVDIANNFIKIANKGIAAATEPSGVTIYTVGSFDNYESANKLKNEVAGDVKDAFVVAFYEDKKISLEEAKLLEEKK